MTDQPFVEVEASPTFNRNLRALAKKYRSIRNDIHTNNRTFTDGHHYRHQD